MKKYSNIMNNEDGSLIVVVILLLVLLTIIGTLTIRNSMLETQISANDNFQKKAFYNAEAGANVGIEILEQNINCPGGFTAAGGTGNDDYAYVEIGDLMIMAQAKTGDFSDLAFWKNPNDLDDAYELRPSSDSSSSVHDGVYDFYFPRSSSADVTTYVKMGGNAALAPGGAIQMAAGYEGKGKGSAGGGAVISFEIYSLREGRMGKSTMQSEVGLDWLHLIGQESECIY